MSEYLDPVDRPTRWFSVGILMLGIAIFVPCELVVIFALLSPPKPDAQPEEFWMGLRLFVFLAVLIAACVWMLIRVRNNAISSNGMTMMPLWFIRCFGLFFLCVAVMMGLKWHIHGAMLALTLALPMIFVGRFIKAANQKTPDISANQKSPDISPK